VWCRAGAAKACFQQVLLAVHMYLSGCVCAGLIKLAIAGSLGCIQEVRTHRHHPITYAKL